MTTFRRPSHRPADQPVGRPGPNRPYATLTGPIADAPIALEWEVSSSNSASTSPLCTHNAYRYSAGLHPRNCANDTPKITTARSGRVDSR